jgi:hypothetical protein
MNMSELESRLRYYGISDALTGKRTKAIDILSALGAVIGRDGPVAAAAVAASIRIHLLAEKGERYCDESFDILSVASSVLERARNLS